MRDNRLLGSPDPSSDRILTRFFFKSNLEEIKDSGKDSVLYRAIGSVMKKVEDVEKLRSELTEEKETMEIRNKSLKNQIETVNKELEGMQKKLTPVLQKVQEESGKNASQ